MSSVVVLEKSETPAGVRFSLWMSKVRGADQNQVNNEINLKNFNRGKPEPKKNSCLCSPTNHPGSFRCRYHRAMAAQKVKPIDQEHAAAHVARHILTMSTKPVIPVGVKPQLSRFSKAAVAVVAPEPELPR